MEDLWSKLFKKSPAPPSTSTPPPKPEEEMPKEEEKIEEAPKEIPPKVEAPKIPEEAPKVEFDLSEQKESPLITITIYGLKGEGKTYLTCGLPGSIVFLSFDRKALIAKKFFPNKDIRVFDAIRYFSEETPEASLKSAEITYNYLIKILDSLKQNPPDWIVFDGSEIEQHICELVMRYRNGLMPFEGIANRNLWKERRMYIRFLHRKAESIAKKGIVYTTYVDKDEIVEKGEVVTKKDVPRWIDVILYETDVVIKCEGMFDLTKMRKQFFALVESSKIPSLPTGLRVDVTNNVDKFWEVLK